MAKADFFRNMPVEVITELEALSRLQFELRETCKHVLSQHGEEDIASFGQALGAGRHAPEAAIDYVRVAVLANEQAAVHAELAARIEGKPFESASVHSMVTELIDSQHVQRYPGGATRRLDALELLDIDGVARILRIAAADCWAIEWGEDSTVAQLLLRLPGEHELRYRPADGQWHSEPLSTLQDPGVIVDIAGIVNILLNKK